MPAGRKSEGVVPEKHMEWEYEYETAGWGTIKTPLQHSCPATDFCLPRGVGFAPAPRLWPPLHFPHFPSFPFAIRHFPFRLSQFGRNKRFNQWTMGKPEPKNSKYLTPPPLLSYFFPTHNDNVNFHSPKNQMDL